MPKELTEEERDAALLKAMEFKTPEPSPAWTYRDKSGKLIQSDKPPFTFADLSKRIEQRNQEIITHKRNDQFQGALIALVFIIFSVLAIVGFRSILRRIV